MRSAELFRQQCLDEGLSRATVKKKLKSLKRLFQLAVERKQLDENPLRYIDLPKSPRKKIEVYSGDECERIIRAARDYKSSVRWDLLIIVALSTAMRKGELLNTTWADIDFERHAIDVCPKKDMDKTWAWQVKDTERRTLPLTDDVVSMLAEQQGSLPEGCQCPYVFVPICRYEKIQQLRKKKKWKYVDSRLMVVNNFNLQFRKILRRAGVKKLRTFHDLRSTALTHWLHSGMSEFEVMKLAGHASFETTHSFYLAVSDDLLIKARRTTAESLAHIWHTPCFSSKND